VGKRLAVSLKRVFDEIGILGLLTLGGKALGSITKTRFWGNWDTWLAHFGWGSDWQYPKNAFLRKSGYSASSAERGKRLAVSLKRVFDEIGILGLLTLAK